VISNEQQREKIARAGMLEAYTDFNYQKIAKYMIDLAETATYDSLWATIM